MSDSRTTLAAGALASGAQVVEPFVATLPPSAPAAPTASAAYPAAPNQPAPGSAAAPTSPPAGGPVTVNPAPANPPAQNPPARNPPAPTTPPPSVPGPSAPSHLKYFGFYLVNTGIDDPTDGIIKTNYTDEVSDFTNLNQYSVYHPAQEIVKDIDAMVAACTKPFMSISGIFWSRVDGNAPSGNRYALYPDWKARWDAFKVKNQAALTNNRIGAFYLVDEPLWNGVPFSEIDAVSQVLKADYPAIPVLLVEAYPMLSNLRIPKAVDWVGFDRYSVFDPAKNTAYLSDLAMLKSKRSNNQKIVIIGDAQWLPSYEIDYGISPSKMGLTFDSYYQLAASDPDVIGLIGYLWPAGFDSPRALGARNLPSEVQAILVNQGKRIKANYSPCRDDR